MMELDERERYTLMQDGIAVDFQPRNASGAIVALNRAHWFSVHGTACEILTPEGRLLARWVRGERADLDPPLRARVARVAREM